MILIEELHNYFDLWIDKVGAPYFTSNQKDDFFRRASVQYINQYLKHPSSHILEDTHVDTEDVHTLIQRVEVVSDAKGRVFFSDINVALPDGKEWMYFLAVGRGSSTDCGGELYKSRWMKHNNLYPQRRNHFKRPEAEYPIHKYYSEFIEFEPYSESNSEFTLIVYPNSVSLDDPSDQLIRGANAIDLDLPDKVFNEIVYLALTQAGVNIREQEFYAATEREAGKNV